MTVEDLRTLGADADDGLERCMNNEDFYIKLDTKVLSEDKFEKLKDEFDAKDTENAFKTAHGLKGVLGNMALTPLFVPVSELTELLRGGGEVSDDKGYLDEIFNQLEKFRALL